MSTETASSSNRDVDSDVTRDIDSDVTRDVDSDVTSTEQSPADVDVTTSPTNLATESGVVQRKTSHLTDDNDDDTQTEVTADDVTRPANEKKTD